MTNETHEQIMQYIAKIRAGIEVDHGLAMGAGIELEQVMRANAREFHALIDRVSEDLVINHAQAVEKLERLAVNMGILAPQAITERPYKKVQHQHDIDAITRALEQERGADFDTEPVPEFFANGGRG